MSTYADNRVGYTTTEMVEGIAKNMADSRAFFVAFDSLIDSLQCDSSPYTGYTRRALFTLSVNIGMWGNGYINQQQLEEAIYRFCTNHHIVDKRVDELIGYFVNSYIMENLDKQKRNWK